MSAGESSFLLWLREVVQPQADPRSGNAAALDDFSPDGMREYCYPKEFTVSGDAYMWSVSSAHTKGRHLCTHYEIWFRASDWLWPENRHPQSYQSQNTARSKKNL